MLGIITPIENQESCSNAACHAHPKEKQILGVLDINLSLEHHRRQSRARALATMIAYTVLAVMLISLATWLFVWRVVHEPLGVLQAGTERLTHGDLGYQIEPNSNDEVGELARSFNEMSRQLRNARDEITAWNRTLEDRVLEKTSELKKAAERMLHVEKMATHRQDGGGGRARDQQSALRNSDVLEAGEAMDRARRVRRRHQAPEMAENLDLVARESRRCGDLVKNLLSFSRSNPINLEWIQLNPIVDRVVKLAAHKLEMAAIQIHVVTTDRVAAGPRRCRANRAGAAGVDHECYRRHAARRQSLDHNHLSPSIASCCMQVRDDGSGHPG